MPETTLTHDIESLDVCSLPSVAYAARRELPRIGAVYFVMKGETVLYIGRTGDLKNRWASHQIKLYLVEVGPTAIAWLQIESNERRPAIERFCIARFDPPFNLKKPHAKGN